MMKKLNMFRPLKFSTQWQNLCCMSKTWLIKRHIDFVCQVSIHLLMCLVVHGLMWFYILCFSEGYDAGHQLYKGPKSVRGQVLSPFEPEYAGINSLLSTLH